MVQTSAMATGVAIIGRMKMPRRKPRSGKRMEDERRDVPRTSGSTTASTV